MRQEVNTHYRLGQAYAPPRGTSRTDGTADHASTYDGGVTKSSVLNWDEKDSDVKRDTFK
jgi:hypothetical protein